jgi:hypothetical protein
MRNVIPIFLFVATALTGCHSPSLVQTKPAAPTVATLPPFRPMLITTLGTNISSDGSWRIGVSENSLDFTRLRAHIDGQGFSSITVSPQEWAAQAGWFVFVENESRVWAYDGDRKLLLQTETVSGNKSTGSTYSSGYPCAVPAEVFARISAPTQRVIERHE